MGKLQFLTYAVCVSSLFIFSCSERNTLPFEPPTVNKFVGQFVGKEDAWILASNKVESSKDLNVKVSQASAESLTINYTYSTSETFDFNANIDGANDFKIPYQKQKNSTLGIKGYGKINENVLTIHIEKDSSKMIYEYYGKRN
jgi:hypothetical protein